MSICEFMHALFVCLFFGGEEVNCIRKWILLGFVDHLQENGWQEHLAVNTWSAFTLASALHLMVAGEVKDAHRAFVCR